MCHINTLSLLHLGSAHVQKNEIAVTGQGNDTAALWTKAVFQDDDSWGFFSHVDVKCLFLREALWPKSGRSKHENTSLNVTFSFSLEGAFRPVFTERPEDTIQTKCEQKMHQCIQK